MSMNIMHPNAHLHAVSSAGALILARAMCSDQLPTRWFYQSAHERPSPRHLPCYLAIDANAVTQARGASIQAREADDEPSAHPPCHRDSRARRATAANSQKPPRAPDALKYMGSSACRPVRDTHNGTAPLPGSLSPLPRRRLPHLVLQAGRAAREEHRGRLRATDRAQGRCM